MLPGFDAKVPMLRNHSVFGLWPTVTWVQGKYKRKANNDRLSHKQLQTIHISYRLRLQPRACTCVVPANSFKQTGFLTRVDSRKLKGEPCKKYRQKERIRFRRGAVCTPGSHSVICGHAHSCISLDLLQQSSTAPSPKFRHGSRSRSSSIKQCLIRNGTP